MFKFWGKGAKMTQKENEIRKLRHDLTNLKPGDSWTVEFPDNNITFPKKLKVGLFGTTGIGKSSLLNSLKYALKGELTDVMVTQTSTANFHGAHTVRRLEVGMTRYLTFIDNKGIGSEEVDSIPAANVIIRQLEGRSPHTEKVDYGEECSNTETAIDEDARIYCTILVFDARNSDTVGGFISKLVEIIVEWQGSYPIGVITNVDIATPKQLDNMYVVLQSAGLSDSYEVANIITDKTNEKTREELSLDHQLNLLKLMKRCFREGDKIFALREPIELEEVQQAEKREREAEEEGQKQAELEKRKKEEKQAKEAEDARIAEEKKEKENKEREEEKKKRALQETIQTILIFLLAIFLVLFGIWLGRK